MTSLVWHVRSILSPPGDDFSDVTDTELRELCLGFVEQLRSGKPAGVIAMVMRSRGVTDAMVARVQKAAGGSAPPPAKAQSEKKTKDKCT